MDYSAALASDATDQREWQEQPLGVQSDFALLNHAQGALKLVEEMILKDDRVSEPWKERGKWSLEVSAVQEKLTALATAYSVFVSKQDQNQGEAFVSITPAMESNSRNDATE